MSNDYSLSDIQRALNEKKAKQSQQRQNLVESMAQQMPVKHVSEEDKRYQVTEQRLTALANRVENLMGMSGRLSLVEETANTLVSGVGHNALGGSQGSGIVNVADADDVLITGISHGEGLVWDQSLLAFVPKQIGSGGGGGGTLSETLFLGNTADRDIEFSDDKGIVYNYLSTVSEYGHNTWRTATDIHGDIIKRESFENSLDSAKIVQLDTKYDKDNGKGVYVEATGSGTEGGISLHNFDSKTVDWQDSTLGKRIVNVDVLNDRLDAEKLILIETAVQRVTFADAKDVPSSIYTGSNTDFKNMKKFGIHNEGFNGIPLTPTPIQRYPKGSYLILEKINTSDYGLFEITVDGKIRGNTTEFDDGTGTGILYLDGQGSLNQGDRVNVYAFNKNYDLTLLQLILHEIEAKVSVDGDTMTGGLTINNADKVANPISFEIRGIQSTGGGSNYVFSSHLDSRDRDICEYHGPVDDPSEIVNKRYVDNLIQSIAGGLNYLGEIEDETPAQIEVPGDPGDFYIFAKDRNWHGNPVKKGDWLIYDGTDWNILSRDQSSDYLPLTGGTMQGDISMGSGNSIRMDGTTPIFTRRIDSGNNSNISFHRDGDKKLQIATESVQVFKDLSLENQSNLSVRNGCQIRSNGNWIMTWFGNGVRYSGQISDDQDITTKKYVDDKVGNLALVGDYLPLDGSEDMTGNLKITNTTNNNSTAAIHLKGSRTNGNESAAEIKFQNDDVGTNDASTGYLTYRASSTDKFFRFSKKLEVKGDLDVTGVAKVTDLETTGTGSKMKYLEVDIGNSSSTAVKVRGKVDIDVRDGDATGLEAKLNLIGARTGNNNAVCSILFDNNNSTNQGALGFYSEETSDDDKTFFRFNHDVNIAGNAFKGVQKLNLLNDAYVTVDALNCLHFMRSWKGDAGYAQTQVLRAHANNRRTFAIRGKDNAGNDNDILYVYTNSTGDSAEYKGRIANQWDLVNKSYVDGQDNTKYNDMKVYVDNQDTAKFNEMKLYVDTKPAIARTVAQIPDNPTPGGLYKIGDQLYMGV